MSEKGTERKQEILEAALHEFIDEGFSGARLQSIADQTGVTKAMIHYYFDTKEKLFREVFRGACTRLLKYLLPILDQENPLFLKVEEFIDQTINRVAENPALARFVIGELNNHPEQTLAIFREIHGYEATIFEKQLQKAADNYEIAPVTGNQLIANMLALCIFPYMAQVFLKELLVTSNESYGTLLARRKEVVKDTIINWLAG